MEHANAISGRSLCDYIIEPQVLKQYNEFRFDAYQKIYDQGYTDTIEYIKNNPEILHLVNQEKVPVIPPPF